MSQGGWRKGLQAKWGSETDTRVLHAVLFQSWPGRLPPEIWGESSHGECYVVPFPTEEAKEKSIFCHEARTKLREKE